MDTDIKELIGSFTAAVSELKDKISDLDGKFSQIMDGANAAYADWDHTNKKNAFSERNKDFLDKYSAKLKAIEGDDFDLAEEAMKVPEGADEVQYVAALASSIDEQLEALKKALNDVSDEQVQEISAENTESGDTEISETTDGEVDEPVAEVKEESKEEETPAESESESEEKVEEEEPEESDEEKLAREVAAEKNKDRSLR